MNLGELYDKWVIARSDMWCLERELKRTVRYHGSRMDTCIGTEYCARVGPTVLRVICDHHGHETFSVPVSLSPELDQRSIELGVVTQSIRNPLEVRG